MLPLLNELSDIIGLKLILKNKTVSRRLIEQNNNIANRYSTKKLNLNILEFYFMIDYTCDISIIDDRI